MRIKTVLCCAIASGPFLSEPHPDVRGPEPVPYNLPPGTDPDLNDMKSPLRIRSKIKIKPDPALLRTSCLSNKKKFKKIS
jgi:hypothetical protein